MKHRLWVTEAKNTESPIEVSGMKRQASRNYAFHKYDKETGFSRGKKGKMVGKQRFEGWRSFT